jgi:hypothetical protein
VFSMVLHGCDVPRRRLDFEPPRMYHADRSKGIHHLPWIIMQGDLCQHRHLSMCLLASVLSLVGQWVLNSQAADGRSTPVILPPYVLIRSL